ncbi:transposase [Gammaproteobacteria bacterium]
MPRRPRVHLDAVPLHIVQRGHNREPCFFGEEDYHTYLHWLSEALKMARCALHAYALMTNHVHLLVTPEHAKFVPRLIVALGRRYRLTDKYIPNNQLYWYDRRLQLVNTKFLKEYEMVTLIFSK